jgi:rubrerythrin
MEYSEVLDRLRDLIRVDIDAVHAYAAFVKHFDDTAGREKVSRFHRDHEMHVMELSSMITSIEDENAPAFTLPFQGFSTEGFGMPDPTQPFEQAIRIMLENERILVAHYKTVVAIHEMPPEFHMVIDRYHKQEQKHLSFLEELLEREEIEQAGAT